MANAKKLPSGRWNVLVYAGKDAQGKRRYESFTADTKKEAERDAAVYIMERKRRRHESITLGEAIDRFVETCRVQEYSPATIRDYVSRRKNSFPSIINQRMEDITPQDIQKAMNERSRIVSPKTVRNDFYLIRIVFEKFSPQTNLNGVTIAKKKKRKKLVMQESWSYDVLTYALEHWQSEFYLYCCFVISAGLRPSQTYALTWADISAEPITTIGQRKVGTINIEKACVRGENGMELKGTKTESGIRQLTLDWSFFGNIYEHKQRGSDDERVFDMKPALVQYRWKVCRRALGIPQSIRYYDLRHYYATSLAYAGASEEQLAASMGHSTSTFSHQVYVQLFEERQRSVNDKMAQATSRLYRSISDQKSSKNSVMQNEMQNAEEQTP